MKKPKITLGSDKSSSPIIAKRLNRVRRVTIPFSKRQMNELRNFFKRATPAQKRFVSGVMADQFAERYRLRGSHRTLTLEHSAKANIHGFDQGNKLGSHPRYGVRIDEVKGGHSPPSKAQQKPTFVTDRASKILRGVPGYQKASRAEFGMARGVRDTLKSGGSVHYGVLRVQQTPQGIRITDKPLYRIMQRHTGAVGGPVTSRRDPSVIKPSARNFIAKNRLTGRSLVIDRRSLPGKLTPTLGRSSAAKPMAMLSVTNKLGPGLARTAKMLTGAVRVLRPFLRVIR